MGEKLDKPIREATVIENRAIIQGDWKLIFGSGQGGISGRYYKQQLEESALNELEGELYNLKDDPSEKNNLYAERPDIVKGLTSIMNKYKQNHLYFQGFLH